MGDPKKQKKKYQGPGHPWQRDRISREQELLREYGLKNKKELWRINSLLRNWRTQARNIISMPEDERANSQEILINKLNKLGLIDKSSQLDDVLSLDTKNLLERRLQTIVYKQGLANSVKQARQFITHNKVLINEKSNSSPAQLLKTEDKVSFISGFKPTIIKTVKKETKGVWKAKEKPVGEVVPTAETVAAGVKK